MVEIETFFLLLMVAIGYLGRSGTCMHQSSRLYGLDKRNYILNQINVCRVYNQVLLYLF